LVFTILFLRCPTLRLKGLHGEGVKEVQILTVQGLRMVALLSEDGLEIIVNKITKETGMSVQGYARMSGKNVSTISRRLKVLHGEGVKEVQILTAQGLQGVALLSEDVIGDWLFDDNPKMAKVFMKMGIRAGLLKMAGYSIQASDEPVEKEPTVAGYLPVWREKREDGHFIQVAFQKATIVKKHPAWDVHDMITWMATGKTAKDARRMPVIEGNPEIGLNHQPNADELELINETKRQYIRINGKKGEIWQEQVRRAFHSALEVLNKKTKESGYLEHYLAEADRIFGDTISSSDKYGWARRWTDEFIASQN
jgi:hypothetical protein